MADPDICKDCGKYPARVPYSVCEECFRRRMRRFLKAGGLRVIS